MVAPFHAKAAVAMHTSRTFFSGLRELISDPTSDQFQVETGLISGLKTEYRRKEIASKRLFHGAIW